MTGRVRYLVPFLAAGGGVLSGHLAASAAASVTTLEVQTRMAAATRTIERLEKAVSADVAIQSLEPPTDIRPLHEPIRGPIEIESSSVRLVGRRHDRVLIFGWEVRLVNRGTAPSAMRALLYLADAQGEPVLELDEPYVVVRPECPRVVRGVIEVPDLCYQRTYVSVMFNDNDVEKRSVLDRIKERTNCK